MTKAINKELVELIAEKLWQRDYPKGGSMFKTYASTHEYDKELYRKEVHFVLDQLSAITQSQAVDGVFETSTCPDCNKRLIKCECKIGPVIDKDALLREAKTLCEWLMNSDMAIREGDEGQESPVLDKINETLKKLREAGY